MDPEQTDSYWVGFLAGALIGIAEDTNDEAARQRARRALRRLADADIVTDGIATDIDRLDGLHSVKVQP